MSNIVLTELHAGIVIGIFCWVPVQNLFEASDLHYPTNGKIEDCAYANLCVQPDDTVAILRPSHTTTTGRILPIFRFIVRTGEGHQFTLY